MFREPSERADHAARQCIGAAIEVHRGLGPGFLEATYEAALCIELARRGIEFRQQVEATVDYKGIQVGAIRIDLIVDECLVVELKAVEDLAPIHRAQALAYLRATKLELALLINFNTVVLKHGIRRIISTTDDAATASPS